MEKQSICVVDVGGSGGRVSALSRDSGGYSLETIHEFSHPVHDFHLTAADGQTRRRLVWNALTIYAGIEEGLRRLARPGRGKIVSFSADGWGADGVWMNRDGDPLCHPVFAHDDRWLEARAEVERILPGKKRFELTGTYPDHFLTVNQIYWYSTRQADMVELADCYMPLPSLYHYWICGEKAGEFTWLTTGHLGSSLTKSYCEPVFAALGLPLDKMPPFRRTGEILGQCHAGLAERLGLNRFRVVAGPNHDTACAYAAAPVRPGRPSLVISAGTWWCMGTPLPEPLVNDAVFSSGFSNVGGADGGAILNVINMGSLPAQALRRQWSLEDGRDMTWDEFNRIAAAGLRPGMVFDIDNPRLRTAHDMAACVAEIAGIAGSGPGRHDLAALVYAGLAGKAAKLAIVLGGLLGRPIEEILVIGGGAKNGLLNQLLADVSGLPVRTGPPNATSMGSALVQAVAMGWFSSLDEGRAALGGLWNESVFLPGRGNWPEFYGKVT